MSHIYVQLLDTQYVNGDPKSRYKGPVRNLLGKILVYALPRTGEYVSVDGNAYRVEEVIHVAGQIPYAVVMPCLQTRGATERPDIADLSVDHPHKDKP